MSSCIDLKERFGRRYRVVYEESYAAEHGERGRGHEPWLLTIPCQHGQIYPHGGQLLGASTNRRGKIANCLAGLSCVRVVQDGDDGVNAVFHVNDFAKVAALLKPKRRRQLTPEQIAERTERLRQYRFPPASQHAHSDRRRDPMPTADFPAV